MRYFKFVIVFCAAGIGCTQNQNEPPIPVVSFAEKVSLEEFQQKEPVFSNNFSFIEKQTIEFPDNVEHSFGIAANLLFTPDYIITIDQRLSKIHLLDRSGNYIANMGRQGRGPGEYLFLQFWDYNDGVLYLYDGGLRKFSFIQLPSLEVISEFTIEGVRISDFKIVQNKIVALTPPLMEGGGLVSLIDPVSRTILHQTHGIKDVPKAIYFARNNTGALEKIDDNTVILLYPDRNYLFSYEILDDRIIPQTEYVFETGHNHFRPEIKPFPQSLNPYENNEEHREWVESQTHFHWMSFLPPDEIVLTGAYRQDNEFIYFMNAYKTDGNVRFEGIALPSDSLSFPMSSVGEYLVFPVRDDTAENRFDFYLASPENR